MNLKSDHFLWGVGFGLACPSIIRTIWCGMLGLNSFSDHLWVVWILFVFLAGLCQSIYRMNRDRWGAKGVARSTVRNELIHFLVGFMLSLGVSDLFAALLGLHDLKVSIHQEIRIVADIILMLLGAVGYWRYRPEYNIR